MPDPFSTLPWPLPLMVMESIEDLSALNYLLQASPDANAVFGKYYCEVTEAIFSTFAPKLQQLLRMIIAVRSESSGTKNELASAEMLDGFLAKQVFEKIPKPKPSDEPLANTSTSLSVVRSLATSASHVQQLLKPFFDIHAERFNNIKPSYLPDQRFNYCYRFRNKLKQPPEGRRYEPLKCSDPSWIEEQRVCRALWRLVLYFDLVASGQRKGEGPLRFWSELQRYEIEEMKCVYDYLRRSVIATPPPSSTQQPYLSRLSEIYPKSITVPQPIPTETSRVMCWQQAVIHLDRGSSAYGTLSDLLRYNIYSPLYRTAFKPFRDLGFVIWDSEKLARLGLSVGEQKRLPEEYWVTPTGDCSSSDGWFRWKSLIDEDS